MVNDMVVESQVIQVSLSPQGQACEAQCPEFIRSAITRACRRIAPLWPLRNFVAVNPYVGMLEHRFVSAAQIVQQRAGASMTAPRDYYADAIRTGRITDADLEVALAESESSLSTPTSLATLKAFAQTARDEAAFASIPTVADVASDVTGQTWDTFVVDAISRWAGGYFDQGQAYWRSPWADLSPFAAWRQEALLDRTPEVMGLHHFRTVIGRLPDSATDCIEQALAMLDVPSAGLDAYLHRLLLSINGWASYVRYLVWQSELQGGTNTALEELLAIRLAWEVALVQTLEQTDVPATWQERRHEIAADLPQDAILQLERDCVLQRAFEVAYQRQLFKQLATTRTEPAPRPKVAQAVFCIDVRSEVFRRALETVSDGVETIGFAGFFGFAVEYVRLGEAKGGAQCPVLLTPGFVINETISGASDTQVARVAEQRNLYRRVAKAWRMFKFGAVSCFGFVGPVGLMYLKDLIGDTLGRSRPVPLPAAYGLGKATLAKLQPRVSPGVAGAQANGHANGMTLSQQISTALGALRAMSLTENFARIVMLVGHGSTTVNNPYASGLDCGACGGHAGEANARVAAQVLNNPAVRAGLREHGIDIPDDTLFLAALHDTTTDQVTIFDTHAIPESHTGDIAYLESQLVQAGQLARAERAVLLGIPDGQDVDKAILRRSRDWSQVRPEWGLAGCAAFVVASRQRTAGINLGGRTFLHSYEWQQDTDFKVLELIMTAPMIVASWINLQYFASTVDNAFFGSGNKVLHNVVGALGVLEGNGGDLRTGLPWQSVHDGSRFVHEPVRLTVLIEAPIGAISDVIARHESVRQLADNGWLHLFAMNTDGRVTHHYTGSGQWMPCTPTDYSG